MREKLKENKVLQVLNKILKFISWIVLIFLLVIAGFLIYYVLMAKKAEKAGVDYKPPMALYTIISPSMVPNINVYDVVFNMKVDDPNSLEKGDVITFVSSDSYMKGMIITHRIVEKYVTNEGVQFKTKGDANVEADSSLVFEENIIGKVMFRIPQLGRVQFFLSNKSGWFIAILIPALLVISYDIFKLFRLLVLKKQLDEQENKYNKSRISEEDGEKVLNLENKTEENKEETIESDIKEEVVKEEEEENLEKQNEEETEESDIKEEDEGELEEGKLEKQNNEETEESDIKEEDEKELEEENLEKQNNEETEESDITEEINEQKNLKDSEIKVEVKPAEEEIVDQDETEENGKELENNFDDTIDEEKIRKEKAKLLIEELYKANKNNKNTESQESINKLLEELQKKNK